MPKKKKPNTQIHLLYNSKFLPFPWVVLVVGDSSHYGIFDAKGKPYPGVYAKWRTKADALKDAIEQAKAQQPSSLRIHGKDGRIVKNGERSYGKGSESPAKG